MYTGSNHLFRVCLPELFMVQLEHGPKSLKRFVVAASVFPSITSKSTCFVTTSWLCHLGGCRIVSWKPVTKGDLCL